jgi:hypothetical protein
MVLTSNPHLPTHDVPHPSQCNLAHFVQPEQIEADQWKCILCVGVPVFTTLQCSCQLPFASVLRSQISGMTMIMAEESTHYHVIAMR